MVVKETHPVSGILSNNWRALSNSRSFTYPHNIMLQHTESSLEHESNNNLPSVELPLLLTPTIILWQTQNQGGVRDASSVRHFVQQLAGLSNSRSSSYPNNIMLQPTESSLEHGLNNKLPSVRRSHLTYILIKLLRMKVLDSNPDLEIIYRKAYAKWTPVLKILARWTMRHNYHCLSFYLQ